MSKRDFYEILGINKSSSQDEIKKDEIEPLKRRIAELESEVSKLKS